MRLALQIIRRSLRGIGIVYVIFAVLPFLIGLNILSMTMAVRGVELTEAVQILIVLPLVALSGVLPKIPVTFLYISDRRSGLLEYLVSMGFEPLDIYKSYLIASLLLSLPLPTLGSVISGVMLSKHISVITAFYIALPLIATLSIVITTTTATIAITSLQSQPTGMNVPLGEAPGAILVVLFFVPVVTQDFLKAFLFDVALCFALLAISFIAIVTLSKRIRAEAMLPS